MPIYLPPPPPGTIRPVILGPNITGYTGRAANDGMYGANGAFYKLTKNGVGSSGNGNQYLAFDASKSNSTYSGSTLQPSSGYVLIIIKA